MPDNEEVLGDATGYINVHDLKVMEEKFRELSRTLVGHMIKIEGACREAAQLMVNMADAYKATQKFQDEKIADDFRELLKEGTDGEAPIQDV